MGARDTQAGHVRLRVTRKLKLKPPKTLAQQKAAYIRRLNDIHVATQITIEALTARRSNIEDDSSPSGYFHFVVPSGGERETARIRRDREHMRAVLDEMIAYGERSRALLMAVSLTEDYILNILKLILRAYPDRIMLGPKGRDHEPSIGLSDVLAKSREDILEERVQARLMSALYASPADYLAYLKVILRIELNGDQIERFVEAKATRDIVVHANGIANELYVRKSGALARATTGQELAVDAAYFGACIATMKALVSAIHSGVNERYGKEEAITAYVARFAR